MSGTALEAGGLMRRICLLSIVALQAAVARAAPPQVNHETVAKAVQRAAEYLYSIRNDQGIWDNPVAPDFKKGLKLGTGGRGLSLLDANWPGRTALALNALASAGQQRDPRFREALKWLIKQEMFGTYGLGMRLELIHRLGGGEALRGVLKADSRTLVRSLRRGDEGMMWQYLPPPAPTFYTYIGDFSNTNYGVLGLWAARDEGMEIPARVWQGLEQAYLLGQLEDGGWAYYHRSHGGSLRQHSTFRSSASMTTAGIVSLYLLLDRLHARRDTLGAHRRTAAYRAIGRGLDWTAEHFSATTNPGWPVFATYYFYNCERVAAAAGLKYFGEHDWFREIAATLLKAQKPDGSIPYRTPPVYGGVLVDTSYALLFLAKGSAPVIFNKLRHAGDWDNRIRDLAGLTDWVARKSEWPANWQIVDLGAEAEDLTDSRILYIAGTEALRFSPDERAKLKRYVELGGLLVFHPDRPSSAFQDSVPQLLAELWPALELTDVDPPSHPLGKIHLPLSGYKGRIRQLATPVRVLAFVVGGDPARAWQGRRYKTSQGAFALGINLHYFANYRALSEELPTKLRLFAEDFRTPAPRTTRKVKLARIKYSEAAYRWNPEPLAFERFTRLLAAREKVNCEIEVVAPAALAGSAAKVAHLTGVDAVELDEQWPRIHAWLERGGTLIVDQAAGPKRERKISFESAFRALMRRRYGGVALRRMMKDRPLIADLGKIRYRNVMGMPRRSMEPRLECVTIDGRPAIIYSRYDLTCGLLGNPNPLVSGADESGAYKLLSHLLLQAAAARRPP